MVTFDRFICSTVVDNDTVTVRNSPWIMLRRRLLGPFRLPTLFPMSDGSHCVFLNIFLVSNGLEPSWPMCQEYSSSSLFSLLRWNQEKGNSWHEFKSSSSSCCSFSRKNGHSIESCRKSLMLFVSEKNDHHQDDSRLQKMMSTKASEDFTKELLWKTVVLLLGLCTSQNNSRGHKAILTGMKPMNDQQKRSF